MTENSNGVVILITLLNILVYKLKKLEEAQQSNRLSLSVRRLCHQFTLRDLMFATNNFHKELVIGEGGFGKVYKGIMDFGYVAIKRLKSTSRQGLKEFQTEIEMLSKFQHSHIVSLIGYCDDCEEMILVYEYMPCGTLDDHLHKRARRGDNSLPPLSWEQRLKICLGAARGLDYLHTGTSTKNRVIHRDVKTSNILLDENLAAKIADFGLSKTGPVNQARTSVSTRVRGTPGYLDPYYISTHRLTKKSDVYAFGVVLFEVLCGRPAVDTSLDEEKISLAGWAQHCYKEGLLEQIVNISIKEDISPDSLTAYVEVAIQCLSYQLKLRPTMAEIVVGLESALTLQEKSTHYSLVEITATDYNQDADSQIPEMENTNRIREKESKEKGVVNVSNGFHHKKQASSRIAFSKMVGVFRTATARLFSAKTFTRSEYPLRYRLGERVIFEPASSKMLFQQKGKTQEFKLFSFTDIVAATRNFSSDNKLGEGGFGPVYKGEFPEGQEIAVKRLSSKSRQAMIELENELFILTELQHTNLIRLIGSCIHEKEKMLIYEFMPNKSLGFFLFNESKREQLTWKTRVSIIGGIAKGLLYLHTYSIILRDLTAAHILLDQNMNPKISNFVLAKILKQDLLEVTRIAGTYGYMAPEYAIQGILSVKCDIYSFGVLILEILSGQRVHYFAGVDRPREYLVAEAWELWNRDATLELLDSSISLSCVHDQFLKYVHIGLLCVQVRAVDRPTMDDVISMLQEDTADLPLPKRPAFYTGSELSFSATEATMVDVISEFTNDAADLPLPKGPAFNPIPEKISLNHLSKISLNNLSISE